MLAYYNAIIAVQIGVMTFKVSYEEKYLPSYYHNLTICLGQVSDQYRQPNLTFLKAGEDSIQF